MLFFPQLCLSCEPDHRHPPPPSAYGLVLLTAAGRVGALSVLLVQTLALSPAVHGRTAAPLPLLRATVAGDAAPRPRAPLQPLALHWGDSKRGQTHWRWMQVSETGGLSPE